MVAFCHGIDGSLFNLFNVTIFFLKKAAIQITKKYNPFNKQICFKLPLKFLPKSDCLITFIHQYHITVNIFFPFFNMGTLHKHKSREKLIVIQSVTEPFCA